MTDPADIVRAATIGRRAPIGRIRYAAERISAVLDRGADPAVNLLAVRTILEGVADELDAAPQFPLPIRADGTHAYLSTGCLHGEHAYCSAPDGRLGRKAGARCKWCPAVCSCACHQGEEAAPAEGCSQDEGFCEAHGYHRHAERPVVMAVELLHAPTTPDGPTITAGFDPDIEIPELDAQGMPLPTPATQVSEPRCVCGDPIQWMDHPDDPGWIHTPGSDTTCLDARPSIADPATVADRPACPCCTSGDHTDPCTCDGVACCCPGRHAEVRL